MPRDPLRSYNLLDDGLDDVARRRILTQALGRLSEASPNFRDVLTGFLRSLPAPGFRSAVRAPVGRQVSVLEPLFKGTGHVFIAVVAIWLEGQPALVQAVRSFLVGRGYSALAIRDLPKTLLGAWEEGQLQQLLAEFLAEHEGFDPKEVALALSVIASRAPAGSSVADENEGPDLEQGMASGPSPMREAPSGLYPEAARDWSALERIGALKDGLASLVALDLDDDALGALRALSAELAEAVEQAIARRESRRRIEVALSELRSDRAADLCYFDYSLEGWFPRAVADSDLRDCIAVIERLSTLLVAHAETRARTPESAAELRRQRADLLQIEAELSGTYRHLAGLFGAGVSVSRPPVDEVAERSDVPAAAVGASGEIHAERTLDGNRGPGGSGPVSVALSESRDRGDPETPTTSDTTESVSELSSHPETSMGSDGSSRPAAVAGGTTPEEASLVADLPGSISNETVVPTSKSEPEPVLERTVLVRGEAQSRWHELLWQLLGAGDVAGAYWLARACEEQQESIPVPSWLLAALQGSFWLDGQADPFVQDLLDISARYVPGGQTQGVLGLAAALKPTLIAPASGMIAWLAPTSYPALHDIVEAVRTFAARGRALLSEDVGSLEPVDVLEAAVTQLRREARDWLEKARHFRSKATKGSDAWAQLVRTDIRDLLGPVIDDKRDLRNGVLRALPQWQRRDPVVARIQKAYRDVTKRRNSELVGEAREQLVRWTAEAADIAVRWCRAVERLAVASQDSDWYAQQLAGLRATVRSALAEGSQRLITLRESDDPVSRGLGTVLTCALAQVASVLQLEPAPALAVRCHLKRRPSTRRQSLEQVLARRLLFLPGVQLTDAGGPTPGGMACVADALCAVPVGELNPVTALRESERSQDFRFTEELLEDVPDDDARAELTRELRSAEAAARSALREQVDAVNGLLEQQVVDGIIGDAERSAYAGRLEAELNASVPDFGRRLGAVARIESELREAAGQRLAVQQQRWRTLEPELAVSHLSQSAKQDIRRRIEAAFQARDTRLVDEFLAQLPEVIAGVIQPPPAWFERKPERDSFERFTGMLSAIEEAAKLGWRTIIEDVSEGRWPQPLRFPHLPKANVKEVVAAFDAWRTLKSSTQRRVDAQRELVTLLAFLGFKATFGSSSVTVVKESGDWLHASARLSDRELSLVPQFGSMTQGAYEVVCVWERPGVDTIGTWLREARLDAHPTILVYLGRLPHMQRRSIARVARRSGWAVLALDESLLIFLAGERDVRLPVFMACTLPFALVNPFTPFQAGDVPPEMFFGRSDMIRDLLAPQGSCIVYGGRQLGKSALLRAVQRKFSNPQKGHVACVVDIKLVGDPQAGLPPTALWPKVRDALKDAGVLGPKVATENPGDLQRHVKEWLRANAGRRLILMLDEADNLLDADAKGNFRVVTALRELMVSTSRRFKVVFAGLHNVQRFQGIPNQPLAHFGTIEVGPLEPDAAYQLVERPFHHLGYRFTQGTILRVLSYTNYHPGLIQLFCHFLLRRLHEKGDADPPYEVGQADVEAVYRDRLVQDGIRDRLDWTLSLDKRYQAIAWTLVVDQMQAREGYARTYSAPEVLSLVSREWPAGFAAIGSDQLRGWLDEMCGLGILVRGVDRRYRLRSPNLVRLMGREDDILQRLIELGDTQPPAVFEADSHHPVLSEQPVRQYSPLTHAQERQLSEPRSGVCLVFASEALGLETLTEAFRRFRPAELPSSFVDLRDERVEPQTLPEVMRAVLGRQAGREGVLACYRPRSIARELIVAVEQAVSFCREHERGRRQQQWVRLLVVLDADATLEWAGISPVQRETLESAVDVALAPRRWDSIAIRQRLEHQQKIHTESAVTKVSIATGGWPILLDELSAMADVDDDLRPEAERLERLLGDHRSDLAGKFRRALGVASSPAALAVLRCIRELQDEGLHDDMVADLVEGTPSIEPTHCLALIEGLLRLGCVERRSDGSLVVEPLAAAVLLGANQT